MGNRLKHSIFLYALLTDLPADSRKYHIVIANSNSGATNHYWHLEDKHVLDEIKKDSSVKVTLPNSQGMYSTDKGILPISNYLSKKSTTSYSLTTIIKPIVDILRLIMRR